MWETKQVCSWFSNAKNSLDGDRPPREVLEAFK